MFAVFCIFFFGGEKTISIVYISMYICDANYKHSYGVYIIFRYANIPYFFQPFRRKVMVHGDDKGLVLPPYVAGIQVGACGCFIEAENKTSQTVSCSKTCKLTVSLRIWIARLSFEL